ncbi:amino acid adenylation domain-containing protein [Chitinophaga sp. Mgbs1]|uniref:Amino acid adenylation domain-containing protein n=1 Tax=Chitinophaga solisilvae TaxID=1233460 RepID=A0A9Q5GVS5_9BACT|nr:amino acid adenylation domain-containing protein [Chitinophaga solisilvae]
MINIDERQLVLTSAQFAEARHYWEAVSSDIAAWDMQAARLPCSGSHHRDVSAARKCMARELSPAIAERVARLSAGSSTNQLAVWLTVVAALMRIYTGEDHLILGIPLHPHSGTSYGPENGLLSCTCSMDKATTFRTLLTATAEKITRALQFGDFPSDRLLPAQKVPAVLVTPGNPEQPDPAWPPLQIIFGYECTAHTATLYANYETTYLSEEEICHMMEYAELLLAGMLSGPDQPLATISIVPAAFRTQLEQLHAASVPVATAQHLSDAWSEVVNRYGEHTAACDMQQSYTYEALNRHAASLAAQMRQAGVKRGSRVILMLPPAVILPLSILACFKCGVAFVPVDPDIPAERLREITAESAAVCLLTTSSLNREMPEGLPVLRADELHATPAVLTEEPPGTPEDEAYVIFTSGSTGTPKGVVITHRSLHNYIHFLVRRATLTSADATVLTSSYAFDLGYTSLFPILFAGGVLHLLPKEIYLDTSVFLPYVQQHAVTFLKATPSFLLLLSGNRQLLRQYGQSLRLIVSGGEQFNMHVPDNFFASLENVQLMNHYGPTETTIGILTEMVTRSSLEQFRMQPVLGAPIAGTQVFVADKYLNMLPPGVRGELYVSGECLFKGYLKAAHTTDKLIPHPFIPGQLCYRTGDIVSWTDDFRLQFWGRNDSQVKLHGYRIDLKEIEKHLLLYPGTDQVHAAVVSVGNTSAIEAWYTAAVKIPAAAIRAFLLERLPFYMIPAACTQIEKFELTFNGKIDTRQLAGKGIDAAATDIAAIWMGVLGLGDTPPDPAASFFSCGGHSLQAIELIGRIKEQLHRTVTIGDIYRYPELGRFTAFVNSLPDEATPQLYHAEEKEYYPCTHAQRRMFVLQAMEPASCAYNKPVVMQLNGVFDIARYQEAIDKLIERHECLRTSFHVMEDDICQQVHPPASCAVRVKDVTGTDAGFFLRGLVRPFNLEQSPLVRSTVLQTGSEAYLLFLDVHHITSDALSTQLLIEELFAIYSGSAVPAPDFQFRDYAVWTNSEDYQHKLAYQRSFWKEYLQGASRTPLPGILPGRPPKAGGKADVRHGYIDGELFSRISDFIRTKQVTLFSFMLAGFQALLYRLTGAMDILVGSSVDGRDASWQKHIAGIFINTITIRQAVQPRQSFNDFLEDVAANIASVLQHRQYPFDLLVEDLQEVPVPGRHPFFDVFFEQLPFSRELPELQDLRIAFRPSDVAAAKFPLAVYLLPATDTLRIDIECDQGIYPDDFASNFLTQYISLIRQVCQQPDIAIDALSADK